MKFELNEYKTSLTDEEIISDIQAVAKKLQVDYISISLYRKNGTYSQTAIQGHFGTWKNALSKAGLRTERNSSELKLIKDEDYIQDLLRVTTITDTDTVAYTDYKKYGNYSAEHFFSRFKSWDDVLKLAGLQPTGLARQKISEQELLEEIERIWIMLGRQPTTTDITKNNISKYSIDTYKRRFGGWRKALEAFVEWINSQEENDDGELVPEDNNRELHISQKNIIQNEEKTSSNSTTSAITHSLHKTSRNINLRLRFRVMQRDNFSCVMCGNSPAKNPNVILHIDHIIPWAKGGETEINNLQTLCSKCNLGKSDLDM